MLSLSDYVYVHITAVDKICNSSIVLTKISTKYHNSTLAVDPINARLMSVIIWTNETPFMSFFWFTLYNTRKHYLVH